MDLKNLPNQRQYLSLELCLPQLDMIKILVHQKRFSIAKLLHLPMSKVFAGLQINTSQDYSELELKPFPGGSLNLPKRNI